HRGVVALIHRDYIKPGRLPMEMGRILSTLSDLRSLGDYGGAIHVGHVEASVALSEAQQFLAAIRSLWMTWWGNTAPWPGNLLNRWPWLSRWAVAAVCNVF